MKKEEFELLIEDQRQNALLAIAVGGEISTYFGTTVRLAKSNRFELLETWNPSDDKALMWGLVKELTKQYSVGIAPLCVQLNLLFDPDEVQFFNCYKDGNTETALIAAYIAADPKGLINNWRKENETN